MGCSASPRRSPCDPRVLTSPPVRALPCLAAPCAIPHHCPAARAIPAPSRRPVCVSHPRYPAARAIPALPRLSVCVSHPLAPPPCAILALPLTTQAGLH